MLRISEHFHASDLGRQRQGNEDNYFVRAPLFVVADGMGGAQAGEVASEMAVESFDGGLPDGAPADGLVSVIEEANRRIHDRSRAESQRAGMGTTVTAAYVGEREVTIAHVGDSRAYVLRDGELTRLTRDHSLVGELVARGKLTEEQAETHPQRSVITRALGPEPEVQVDVQAYQARAGDVFMVCSDGLTSMVPEARVREILQAAGSLEAAGRDLIAAANDAGGRDNITVVLFRLEDVDGDEPAASQRETIEEPRPEGGEAQATATLPRVREAQPIEEPPERTAPPPRKRRRRRVPTGPDRARGRAADRRRGAVDRLARGLLRRRRPAGHRDGLPRAAVRPAARARALRALLRLRRDDRAGAGGPPHHLHRAQAALQGRRRGPRQRARAGPDPVSARNRELLALVPASLLLTAGFAAIFIQQSEVVSDVSLTYGLWFLGLCFAGHLFLRFTLPYADPYMFPLVAVLACFGLVVIYRIDEELAREQAQWFVVGLALFAATILLLRDLRVLERYRYTIAAAGLILLFLPRVPGIGAQVNGAYLGVDLGPIAFQPAEFGKIAIIIFLAAYLRDTRQVLVQGARRVAGVTIPPLKHFGPLLVVWGAAMLMLVFIRDLGSSLMYFGGFLALLYVATNRLSFVVIGTAMFAVGAWFFANTVSHVQDRVDIWLDPFNPAWVEDDGYQIAQSLFAQADGGLFGTGLGASLLNSPGGTPLIPLPSTDLIYAVITNELGLVGACGLILVYMLLAERGFRTATLATDSFSKLLAAGLTAVFALQVFVIVGGVTRVIPLTGVTLPFVSYGGSSIMANFILLALLLLVSDRARRPAGAMGRRGLR